MIDLYSASSNLGDNLSLTPIMWATPARVHLFDDSANHSIAPIFDDLAEVAFDNVAPPRASPEGNAPGPIARKLMVGQGLLPANPIPRIKLKEEEVAKARETLAVMLGDKVSAACVIKANSAKQSVRIPPPEVLRRIVEQNPDVTFINFGLNASHAKHDFLHVSVDGVLEVFNLPIREQAAIYHVIGRYVGPDTGDYHLMLAVGGRCDVLVPHSSWEYDYHRFHYTPDCWTHEAAPRVTYHNWHQSLGVSMVGLILNPFKMTVDKGGFYDMLSIALVKTLKNPQNQEAQRNYLRMTDELEGLVGRARHQLVIMSPEFSAMRDVNMALYDRLGSLQAYKTPEEERRTDELNNGRMEAKRRLQARWFGGQLSEQKFRNEQEAVR